MKSVFADSFYFFALLSRHDSYHERIVELLESSRFRLVTTSFVLIEVGDGLAGGRRRTKLVDLIDEIRSDPANTIVPASEGLLEQGLDLYRKRDDKTWSITDCISFVVMKKMGIAEALTGDKHFVQAGFKALLLSPEESF